MTLYLNGTTGISGVDGSAGTPAVQGTDTNTGISFPAADTIAFNEGGAEVGRFDSSGRLLVGTSSAFDTTTVSTTYQVGLEKAGGYSAFSLKTNANTDEGAYITLGKSRGTTANSKTVVNNGDTLGAIAFEGADGASMRTGAQIQAYVDGTPGSGDLPSRLVFSVTQDGSASPTERLRIGNSGAINAFTSIEGGNFRSGNTTSSSEPALDVFGGASSTGTGTRTFSVRANGNVVNQNNSYGSLSDIKLKENIVDASSQWGDIKALQVRKYNFKEETGHSTHTQIGLIAQELELVSPGLVSESPDRDEDGNDLGTVTKSVNYSVLYMKAVKALQEAMERIEQLETEMAAVKAQLS